MQQTGSVRVHTVAVYSRKVLIMAVNVKTVSVCLKQQRTELHRCSSSLSLSLTSSSLLLSLCSLPPSVVLPSVNSSQGRGERCRCFWHRLFWWGGHQGHQGKVRSNVQTLDLLPIYCTYSTDAVQIISENSRGTTVMMVKWLFSGEFVRRTCPLCTPHTDGHLLVGASSHDMLNSSERRQQVVVLTLIQTL